MRLRLIGGHLRSSQLLALVDAAERFGDGRVRLTGRANLQVRGFPGVNGHLDEEALLALEATGLLPSRTHELVRNVMVSPQSGLAGGRADLRTVASGLDELLRSSEEFAQLPGRFLFVLDDGRGDLVDRSCDLGLVALDEHLGQLRVGDSWGPLTPLTRAALEIAEVAKRFLRVRGSGPTAPWHVNELPEALVPSVAADERVPAPASGLPFGPVPGGIHQEIPENGLHRDDVARLCADVDYLIVTPWRGVLIPQEA